MPPKQPAPKKRRILASLQVERFNRQKRGEELSPINPVRKTITLGQLDGFSFAFLVFDPNHIQRNINSVDELNKWADIKAKIFLPVSAKRNLEHRSDVVFFDYDAGSSQLLSVLKSNHTISSSKFFLVTDDIGRSRQIFENQAMVPKLISLDWLHRSVAESRLVSFESFSASEAHPKLLQPTSPNAGSHSSHSRSSYHTHSDDEDTKASDTERKAAAQGISKYSCQRKSYNSPCVNEQMCQMLLDIETVRELESGSEFVGDFRAVSYRQAAAAIKCYPYKIKSIEEAGEIAHIGESAKKHIAEFLRTGGSQEADRLYHDPKIIAYKILHGVYGVGPKTIKRLYEEHNVRSLEDLQTHLNHLRSIGKPDVVKELGLKYYHDINESTCSREEALKFYDLVSEVAFSICSELEIVLVGGFRRGKLEGHDVDILFTHRSKENGHEEVLGKVVEELKRRNNLVENLTGFTGLYRQHSSMSRDIFARDIGSVCLHHDYFLGILKLNDEGKNRRVDIIGVGRSDFPFALLGWTGSRQFERDIRKYSLDTKRWHLNNHGFFNPDNRKTRIQFLEPIRTEQDIFKVLGLEYLEPNERCV